MNRRAILLLLCLIYHYHTEIAQAQGYSDYYYASVVQTLIDTEAGRQSKKKTELSPAKVKNYLLTKRTAHRTYAKQYMEDANPPRGVFRITVGEHSFRKLPTDWWTKLSLEKSLEGLQVWWRSVKLPTGDYFEILARKRDERLSLEMLLLFEDKNKGALEVQKKFALLVQNAKFHDLFAPEDQRKIEPFVVKPGKVGTWKGLMANTRGGSVSESMMVISKANGKEIVGTWHAKWPMKNAVLKGNVVSWEHVGMANKCRDYKVRLEFLNDGKSAALFYQVHDSCRNPRNYSGVIQYNKIDN